MAAMSVRRSETQTCKVPERSVASRDDLEVEYQGKMVRSQACQRMERGLDALDQDLWADEAMVNAKGRKGRGKGLHGLFKTREPLGVGQVFCQMPIGPRERRAVEVTDEEGRPGAIRMPEPIRASESLDLKALLAGNEAEVCVQDVDRCFSEVELDPECAARLEPGYALDRW